MLITNYKFAFFYVKIEYDTKKIMDSFRKLKSLILNSSIMKFFIDKKPNEEILRLFLNKNNLKCGKKASFQEMLIILNQAELEIRQDQ